MTIKQIAAKCNATEDIVYRLKGRLKFKNRYLTDSQAKRIIYEVSVMGNAGDTIKTLSKKYKVSFTKITKFKNELGLSQGKILLKSEYKQLETAVKAYTSRNTLTLAQRCEIVKQKLDTEGYVKGTDITVLFNGRNLSSSTTAIENFLNIQLYDDELKELKSNKTEDSKSGDKYKYKNTKIFRSQTAIFAKWAEEKKIVNGYSNGYQGHQGKGSSLF